MIALDERDPEDRAALLETGAPVYLFVNPLEYHGPHLSLENDLLVAQGLARDLHARLGEGHKDWPLLTAPLISAGCDVTPGPGAVETPYREVRRLVLRACRSLVEVGARRVVIMTFHGGPNHAHALQAGIRLLEEHGVRALAPLNIVIREMLSLDAAGYREAFSHIEDAKEREAVERELKFDFHAGFFETSLSLHYAPQSVSKALATLPACPDVRPSRLFSWAARVARFFGAAALARELGFVAQAAGWYGVTPFPGYTGRPAHATASAGAFFARQILDRYTAAAREVFAGTRKPPVPIMPWLPVLSLGGRAGPPKPH